MNEARYTPVRLALANPLVGSPIKLRSPLIANLVRRNMTPQVAILAIPTKHKYL